ncbi:integrase arm-type DNA-binding domain-containing protein [uncultured Sphingomonas sp.]|uniref:tyrosine-type recombinase/integrase n=1 Tax=uncultured Sphingomonas sp. TaxID=158754 RepID=UPI002620BDE3|nr:integrase arm-type DNA-binding domain-containing protein [uncultured Sphingomonas sp.]
MNIGVIGITRNLLHVLLHEIEADVATTKISDPWLRGLKAAKPGKWDEWLDKAETGLTVMVNSKRRIRFCLIARFPREDGSIGNPVRRVLGDYQPRDSKDRVFVIRKGVPALTLDEARQKAREWKSALAAGVDPSRPLEENARESPESAPTVGEVFGEFFKRHVMKEGQKDRSGQPLAPLRSADEIKRIFDHYILADLDGNDRWRDRPITSITRKEVTGLLDTISDSSGAVQADGVLAQLSSMLGWYAAREDDFVSPIVRGMKRTKISERKRKRILSDEEIRVFWSATATQGTFGAFCRSLLLTAQRREKVRVMHHDSIADDGLWRIDSEQREKGNASSIRLSPQAMRIIRKQPITATRPYVFQGRLAGPINGFTKDKAALDAKMAEIAGYPIARWVLHDLRRTAKTLMARAGVPRDISERVLGHAIEGVEGVYDQYNYFDEKSEALKKLGKLVDQILKGTNDTAAMRKQRRVPATGR